MEKLNKLHTVRFSYSDSEYLNEQAKLQDRSVGYLIRKFVHDSIEHQLIRATGSNQRKQSTRRAS